MINSIYCVGRNYREHAEELGNKIETEPVIFSKPNSSLINDDLIILPTFSKDIHFETELVLKIAKDCFQVSKEEAEECFNEIAIGLDLTARDLQTNLKERKLPWLLSKGFKGSCYVSSFIDKTLLNTDINFSMQLNGEERQRATTKDMIFNRCEIIAYISQFIQLKEGDVIFTGTSKGVGKLSAGDEIKLLIEDQIMATLSVKDSENI